MGHLIPVGTGFPTHRDIDMVKEVPDLLKSPAPAAAETEKEL